MFNFSLQKPCSSHHNPLSVNNLSNYICISNTIHGFIKLCSRFIACKSDTAGLLKTWFSVKNFTKKSQLFYHFNGLKIGSIHTPTACLLKNLFFCLFVFIIVNWTRPRMWKRPWRPSRTWKSQQMPPRTSKHWK